MTIGQVRMESKEDYTKMGKDHCPACNYQCDSASAVDGKHKPPVPGDYSLCLNCGEWLEFSSDMALIIIPEKTKRLLDEDNRIILTDGAAYIKKRGPIRK